METIRSALRKGGSLLRIPVAATNTLVPTIERDARPEAGGMGGARLGAGRLSTTIPYTADRLLDRTRRTRKPHGSTAPHALVYHGSPVVDLSPDPVDNPILSTAIAGNAALIVYGDARHTLGP